MLRQLLVIEDHAIYRAGLISVIEHIAFTRVTSAGSVEQALATNIVPDLILLDIKLNGMDGLKGISALRLQWPGTKIIIISANDSYTNAQTALELGATAFLSKSDTTETILSVVTNALDNPLTSNVMSPALQHRIAQTPKLSTRQIDVLQLMAKGHSNKTIGQMLHISENTARWHVCTMISILQVSSRTEAVFTARELGLLP